MGRIQEPKHVCADRAHEIREKVSEYIIENYLKLPLMVQESDTNSKKTGDLICLHVNSAHSTDASNLSFDISELKHAETTIVVEATMNTIWSNMFQDILTKNLDISEDGCVPGCCTV
jgi:hypothetical protein